MPHTRSIRSSAIDTEYSPFGVLHGEVIKSYRELLQPRTRQIHVLMYKYDKIIHAPVKRFIVSACSRVEIPLYQYLMAMRTSNARRRKEISFEHLCVVNCYRKGNPFRK